MNVHIVTAVRSVVLPTATARPPADATTARPGQAQPAVRLDEPTQPTTPPRFPWLSWLTARLEPASRQPSPYASTPPLGEKLDRHA